MHVVRNPDKPFNLVGLAETDRAIGSEISGAAPGSG